MNQKTKNKNGCSFSFSMGDERPKNDGATLPQCKEKQTIAPNHMRKCNKIEFNRKSTNQLKRKPNDCYDFILNIGSMFC